MEKLYDLSVVSELTDYSDFGDIENNGQKIGEWFACDKKLTPEDELNIIGRYSNVLFKNTRHEYAPEIKGTIMCVYYDNVPRGTIIHGTMRAQDLIPAFMGVLRNTHIWDSILYPCVKHDQELSFILGKDVDDNDPRWDSEEVSMFLYETLWGYMEDMSPEGYYFGNTEGDGSDYGYWPLEEESQRGCLKSTWGSMNVLK